VAGYVDFEARWNERWELQSDLGPADWLKESFHEVSSQRMESGPGVPVTAIMGNDWEAFLCLPHDTVCERHESGWPYEYLGGQVSKTLVSVLRRHCADIESCWAATWAGFGDNPASIASFPHVVEIRYPGGGHEHLLSRGSLSYIESGGGPEGIWPQFLRSPNYWWPSGREWLVGSEIDTGATYIGCSSDCANEVLALGIKGLVAVKGSDRAIPDFDL
jgi:hypothetical protein